MTKQELKQAQEIKRFVSVRIRGMWQVCSIIKVMTYKVKVSPIGTDQIITVDNYEVEG